MLKFKVFFLLLVVLVSCKKEDVKNSEIFVNQVGYLTHEKKIFVTDKEVYYFYIIDKTSNQTVYKDKLKLKIQIDPATGKDLYIGDFTHLTIEGDYYIKLSNGLVSNSFKIEKDIYNKVRDLSIKTFYYNRSALELEEQYAGMFSREAGHKNMIEYHKSSQTNGVKEVSGGWYDDSNYGQFITSASVSVSLMLLSYEQYPEKFQNDNNNIPESNNGVPDLLDEIRYELEWMLKMQNREEGEFYSALPFMLNSKHYKWIKPDKDTKKRYIYDFSTVATANFAAVMAKASRVYKEFDLEFSNRCLDASIKAWDFLSTRGSYPLNGFRPPLDTKTANYLLGNDGDKVDKDDRFWAAVELYITTGENKYLTYINQSIKDLKDTCWDYSWSCSYAIGKIQLLITNVNSVYLKDEIFNDFVSYCDSILDKSDSSGFNTTVDNNEYSWGSNYTILSRAVLLISGYTLTDNKLYFNAALDQLNYILGLNGNNISYVTGVGSNNPNNIHNIITATDSVETVIPGILVAGPNSLIFSDNTLPRYYSEDTPPALCYIDSVDSWASNSSTILYNSALVSVSGYFSEMK